MRRFAMVLTAAAVAPSFAVIRIGLLRKREIHVEPLRRIAATNKPPRHSTTKFNYRLLRHAASRSHGFIQFGSLSYQTT